jgi:alpha-tubulin suppressor-like RCC1 family protein
MLKSKRFKKLAVGDGFSLGICSSTNSLYGWGEGPLIGRKEATPDPVLLPLPPTVKEIIGVYASSHHAAILDAAGRVYTWGQNFDPKGMISSLKQGGQLGQGNRDYYEKPTLIESLASEEIKVVSLALGNQHTLITTDSGKVYSCGVGEYGRLGTGNTSDCLVPSLIETFVTSGEKIVQCAAGTNHSLALTDSGVVYSWGRNETGQLGHFDTYVDVFSLEEYPKKIVSEALEGLKVSQVAAAKGRSAAVTECGKLFLWGSKLNHYPALINPSFFNNQKVVIRPL